ncbi:MAG: hypothetical protein B9S38_12255 [Verrucomicrobiia bacterium Tous-C4TDCM]|nr:MAG: hypothetical protein B9S38_12255 [Verrucomicrobiae bacterium Tous-C4TDCM]
MIPLEKYRDEKSWGWYRMVPDAWQRWVASAHPRRVLEIGAFDGVSANVMLEAIFTHPGSTVDTVDPYLPDPTTPQVAESTRALFEENCRRGGHGDRERLHRGRSLETLARMITDGLSESFDVIFIDGSHLAADVMTDAALAWPLLAPGGILIFDDYEWGRDRPPHQRPREAIDAFESAYVESLVPVWRGYQRIYRKTGVPGGLRLLSGCGLTRRGWFPEPEKMQRILHREIEGFFQTGHPFVGVNYEKVLTAPEFEIERLADELGIKVTESSIERASAVVNRWDGRT